MNPRIPGPDSQGAAMSPGSRAWTSGAMPAAPFPPPRGEGWEAEGQPCGHWHGGTPRSAPAGNATRQRPDRHRPVAPGRSGVALWGPAHQPCEASPGTGSLTLGDRVRTSGDRGHGPRATGARQVRRRDIIDADQRSTGAI